MPIYAIWGPSPEWADGVGVLGYAGSKEAAQDMIWDLIADCEEYGPRSWYGSGGLSPNDYDIVPVDPEELPDELRHLPVDEIIDRLNEMLNG